jgi:hypothetical protein
MLDKTVIDKAVDKKYTELSAVVKAELHHKLSKHEDVVKYAEEYDKIQHMKQMFAQISAQSEE